MNISEIKLGETYQHYWYDSERRLRHTPVVPVKINQKSVRVKSLVQGDEEFRVDPSDLDNRQLEAF